VSIKVPSQKKLQGGSRPSLDCDGAVRCLDLVRLLVRELPGKANFARGAWVIFARPDDVSAVVLTTGEPSTQQAIDSLHRQTVRLHDVIVVGEEVAPFHKALNIGAAQVKTPFFVQVDADMVLDPHCIAALRHGMSRRIGIVAARLRDALIGQVVGVRLYRTDCFNTETFQNSISPDTDFYEAIRRRGWETAYIGRIGRPELDQWATFGEHRPTYTPSYTYRKHLLGGRRYRYRGSTGGLRWHFSRLEASRHPSALVAQVGLAHGFFLDADWDLLGVPHDDHEFPRLDAFLRFPRTSRGCGALALPSAEVTVAERFRWVYRLGCALGAAGDPQTFIRLMRELNDTGAIDRAWILKIALCQGLLADAADEVNIEADYRILQDFLGETDSVLRLSGAPAPIESDLDSINTYAANAGLDRFVLTGPVPPAAEYAASRLGPECVFRETGRKIIVTTDPFGRPRIKVPFRLFGHVACTEPERLTGLFWCGDLLRGGYTCAHLPTSRGPKKVSLLRQFVTNLVQRCGLHSSSLADPQHIFRTMTRQRSPRYEPNAECVLMIIPSFIRGGCERQMVVTAAGLIRRGHDVRILGFDPLDRGVSGMEDEIAKLGVKPQLCDDFRGPRGGGWSRAPEEAALAVDLSQLPRWIADKIGPVSMAILHHRPSVVHAWHDVPAVIGGLAACALGVPRLIISQSGLSVIHFGKCADHLLSAYQYVAGNKNTVLLNNSAAGAADYTRWLGRWTGSIRVLYDGFMPETLRTVSSHEVAQFRATLGIRSEAPVVGALIRFVEEKDPYLWLDTAAKIADARSDVRFLLAGQGVLHNRLVRRAAALGLADRVILPGAISDVGLAYAALDVVLLTSSVEGVPHMLVEAQAAGRPVVTTDVGGVCEALIDGRTGSVVRRRSPECLAEAVLAILSDDLWRTRLRTEGPMFVAERFGFERMIRQTIEAYGIGNNRQVVGVGSSHV
jgi:glycosyltransferase involved in cell wall biosynthesis